MRHASRSLPLLLVLTGLVQGSPAAARPDGDDRARAVYIAGKGAFDQGHYDEAYTRFREAYLLSRVPALLYNMASALEKLQRPHDAAEALRAYLLARPAEPERLALEDRIHSLEESQRWIDAERVKRAPPRLLEFTRSPRAVARGRTAGIVLGTVGGILVVGALGLGLGLGLHHSLPDTQLGNWRATP